MPLLIQDSAAIGAVAGWVECLFRGFGGWAHGAGGAGGEMEFEDWFAGVGDGAAVAFGGVGDAEGHAGTDEELVDDHVLLCPAARGLLDGDAGEDRDFRAERVFDDAAVDVLLQRLGDELGVVFLQNLGFALLDARAVSLAFGNGAEITAAPEGGDEAVHTFDEGIKRRVGAGEVNDLHVFRRIEDDAFGDEEFAEGFFHAVEHVAAASGGGAGNNTGFAVAAGIIGPVAEGEVFAHPGGCAGFHDPVASGDEPGAVLQFDAFDCVRRGEETKAAFGVFEKPERDEAQFRRESVRGWFPDDFVHGVFFADGVHHLPDEKFKAAAFVGVDGVRDENLIVEKFEDFLLFQRLLVSVGAFLREGDDFESIAGDVFLALAGDGFDQVIAILDDFPHHGGVAEIAAVEFVVGGGERISRDVFGGIETLANGEDDAFGGEEVFVGGVHFLTAKYTKYAKGFVTTDDTDFTERSRRAMNCA